LVQARGTALNGLLTGKFQRKLKPQFETRVRRIVFPLERDGTVIELALDQGTIDTGAASMRLCEIELELASGDKAHFVRGRAGCLRARCRFSSLSRASRSAATAFWTARKARR
jgi:inorganic triphosphatase YgiF